MLVVHTSCSLLSYAAFLGAFVSGILFLIQERQLKRKTMGVLFHHLPSLEMLDRVNFMAIGIGFGLLSVGTIFGFLGTERLLGRWWTGDPMEYLTLLLWLVYLALWLLRLGATLRGRRVALLSILGFGIVVFTVIGVSRLVPSWHSFGGDCPRRGLSPTYASASQRDLSPTYASAPCTSS